MRKNGKKRYSQAFISGSREQVRKQLRSYGNDLKNEMANAVGAHIKLKTVGRGDLTCMIQSENVSFSVRNKSRHPHSHSGRYRERLSELMANRARKKGSLVSLHVVKNNGSLKSKERDGVRGGR